MHPISSSWYEKRPLYEQFSEALRDVLDRDVRFPRDAVYAVKHRLKSNERLVQKCEQDDEIDAGNFAERVKDLLGFRIVCLRPSDIDVVKDHVKRLQDDGLLNVLEGPSEKKSFVLNPKVELPDSEVDFQYSGYSSIHYIVALGDKQPIQNPAFRRLRAELQVRNIFEEAWGEIDHKYRYQRTRIGVQVDEATDLGFRALAMYLAAASCHAEYLCRSAKNAQSDAGAKSETAIQPVHATVSAESVGQLIRNVVGVIPTSRTAVYCLRRIEAHATRNAMVPTSTWVEGLLRDSAARSTFDEVYRRLMQGEPFAEAGADRDVVDFVNFALFYSAFPVDIVKRRLETLLDERLKRRAD